MEMLPLGCGSLTIASGQQTNPWGIKIGLGIPEDWMNIVSRIIGLICSTYLWTQKCGSR